MFEAALYAAFALVAVAAAWRLLRGEVAGRLQVRSIDGEGFTVSVVREAPSGSAGAPGIRLQFRHALAASACPLTRDEALALAEALERAAAAADS